MKRVLLVIPIIFLSVILISSLDNSKFDFTYTTPTNYSLIPTVNSSNFWDNLNTPADINAGDITDDGTYTNQTYVDNTFLNLSGTNADRNINISPYNFTTTGNLESNNFKTTSFFPYNVFIGEDAGEYNTVSDPSGTRNVYIGYQAGEGVVGGSNTGNYNVGIGTSALNEVTSGNNNFALGVNVLRSCTSCVSNIGIGTENLKAITTETRNVAIGSASFSGASFAGSENTGIGYVTGLASTSANYNTFLGSRAGQRVTTGDQNIFIGYNAGVRQTTNNQLLIIDNRDRATTTAEELNSLIYGGFGASASSQFLNLNAKVNISQDLNSLGNLKIISDTNKLFLGLAGDKSIKANDTGMYFETNVGDTPFNFDNDLNILENLNVSGNATYNGYYAGMWFHNDTGVPISLSSTPNILNFTDSDHQNGFVWNSPSRLQLKDDGGIYQVIWKTEGTGTNNHEYHGWVYINEQRQNNTIGHTIGTGNNEVKMNGIGFVNINNGDNVTIRLTDQTASSSGTAIDGNINLVRVGNL